MNIIVFDTETTGLLAPIAAGQEYQPYLVEFYGIRMTDKFEFREQLTFRCKPPISIPDEAIRVHNITDAMIADKQPFVQVLPELTHFFLGSHISVGHNLMYDKMVLYWELFRLGKVMNFPWSPGGICTAEVCSQQLGHRLNLTDLHMKLFGAAFSDAHSASVDCEITAKCFIEMVKKGMIVL
jgi:DNA polymerase III epsilon subunit-like protein